MFNKTRRNAMLLTILVIIFIVIISIRAIMLENMLRSVTMELTDTNAQLEETAALLADEYALNSGLEANFSEVSDALFVATAALDNLDYEKYIFDLKISEAEIDIIAKTVWGEAGNCSKLQQSGVIWCILNMVDAGYGTITEVVTPDRFHGYNRSFPVVPEIRDLVIDVVARWKLEKITGYSVGRTLPSEFMYFSGAPTGGENIFRNKYENSDKIWDWDCWNPYEE